MFKKLLPKLAGPLIARLMSENLRSQLTLYGVATFAMILVAGMTSATAWIMRDIVDTMTNPGNHARVFMVAAAVAGIFFLKGIASYIQDVALTRAGNRIVATQQKSLYAKLLRQGVAFFNLTESSDLLSMSSKTPASTSGAARPARWAACSR